MAAASVQRNATFATARHSVGRNCPVKFSPASRVLHARRGSQRAATQRLVVQGMSPPAAPAVSSESRSSGIRSTKPRPSLPKLLFGMAFLMAVTAAVLPAVGYYMANHPDVLEMERVFLVQRSWARKISLLEAQLQTVQPVSAPTQGMQRTPYTGLMEKLADAKYNYLWYGLLLLAHQGQVPGALPMVSDPVLHRTATQGQVSMYKMPTGGTVVSKGTCPAGAPSTHISQVALQLQDLIRLEEIAVQQGTARVNKIRQKHEEVVSSMPVRPTPKSMVQLMASSERLREAEAELISHGLILEQHRRGYIEIHPAMISARAQQIMRDRRAAACKK